jgi:formamidopyrimidine-DNA glycosylase
MPELPEVETIRSSLQVNLGARVKAVEVIRPDIIRQRDYEARDLCGASIVDIARRGKFIIIALDNGLFLVAHMGMTGRFYMVDGDCQVVERHVHFILTLDNGRRLLYQDARRFGGIWFCRSTGELFCHMGREPLSRQFTAAYLEDITRRRKVAIKSLLLNQTLISGIGNIYADEALFEAGIRPQRAAGSLTQGEIKSLHRAIKKVLKKGIAARGTTFRDYRDGYNQSGSFQHLLKVYGKTGEACPICGQTIKKEIIGGRSSHFCEHCQK